MQLNNLHVVLTGPARDSRGRPVLRKDIVEALRLAGATYQTAVTPRTQVLVASRQDTVKAIRAEGAGIKVINYRELLRSLQVNESGSSPDPYTDAQETVGPELDADGYELL